MHNADLDVTISRAATYAEKPLFEFFCRSMHQAARQDAAAVVNHSANLGVRWINLR
jgi:hypothetical protein